MKTIYRLDYFEPYEPDSKYEEVFRLGYYESRERANMEIDSFYKHLPGFKDGGYENYRITEMNVDEFINSSPTDNETNIYYELNYGYDTADEYSVDTVLGVYSRKKWAKMMQEKYQKWTIFILHSHPEFGGEFHIDSYILNQHWWISGFSR